MQNLIRFRISNPVFESFWNRNYIDNVHITFSEDIGVGIRGDFFEETGLLRDVVQKHLMQLLAIVGMEPPKSQNAQDLIEQKIKLLNSIRPFPKDHVEEYIVRGQYGPGNINNSPVLGYQQEKDVAPNSPLETFVAAKLFIDNDRWCDVPFFITAGKRMSKRFTEIVITFKKASADQSGNIPNALVFRIQPDEEIYFTFNSQVPGQGRETQPMKLSFNYKSLFSAPIRDAYERLLHESMLGNHQPFVEFEELLAAWLLWTPVIEYWQKHPPKGFPNYAAGSSAGPGLQ